MNPDLVLKPLAVASHLAPVVGQLAVASSPRQRDHKSGRVAVLHAIGVLTPPFLREFRAEVGAAAADASVRAIALYVDSPGGTVDGSPEVAAAVEAAAKIKPVHVLAEGYLCSAAYWLAAGATSISAAPSTVVGSIGCTISLVDDSEFWRSQGIQFLHITSGIKKTVGYTGQPALLEHVEVLQRLVETGLTQFESAVERGRKLLGSRLDAVADGGVWSAPVAKSKGLIDLIATPEERLTKIKAEHAEQFADLTGRAALEKYLTLARGVKPVSTVIKPEMIEAFDDVPTFTRQVLAKQHPRLSAAAHAEHETQQREQDYRASCRRSLRRL